MRNTNSKYPENMLVIPIRTRDMIVTILAFVEDVDLVTQSICIAWLAITANLSGPSNQEEMLPGFVITDSVEQSALRTQVAT